MLAVIGLMLPLLAQAEKADKDKPMNVEADALRYEEARQTSVFTGNVLITKGTILMRGAKLDVRQDPQGNQYGLLLGTPEKAGFFRQKREGLEEWIEGEGDRIEYDSKAQTVLFTGRAVLRRYRGTLLNDVSEGTEILYNSLTEVFTVKGGDTSKTAANPAGRVRAMLTPIPEEEKNGPAAPATDPAKLRPSGKITEPKK
ncbi:lipopolysaccharide transport periplasmic protein LptA [Hydrogenophaga flava]|uniref:lipopolysaccharide transport periplasmic protein LptA n=1 Tax=Hydrogenophaga flava TaxID=65657 RepID=UPI000824DD84|nr:lipopolysaccharide transport periplasmic protein LptA [Hydrogenophaga flava]